MASEAAAGDGVGIAHHDRHPSSELQTAGVRGGRESQPIACASSSEQRVAVPNNWALIMLSAKHNVLLPAGTRSWDSRLRIRKLRPLPASHGLDSAKWLRCSVWQCRFHSGCGLCRKTARVRVTREGGCEHWDGGDGRWREFRFLPDIGSSSRRLAYLIFSCRSLPRRCEFARSHKRAIRTFRSHPPPLPSDPLPCSFRS